MNIGILYPRSNAHPSISMEFMAAFKAFFTAKDLMHTISISAETAGFGGVDKEVQGKIEQLIIAAEADVLVLYIDQKMFALVRPLLEAFGKPVIIVNPGADYPQSWTPSPHIFHLTLNHAYLCWLTGKLAAAEGVKQGAYATSFYDCGYLHGAMMVNGFLQHGGEIVFNHINKQAYDNRFHIAELLAYLHEEEATQNLFCVYDELPAKLFYSQLASAPNAAQLHLYVSPMMLQHKDIYSTVLSSPFAIHGHVPYAGNEANDANMLMRKLLDRGAAHAAGIFTLLGWEAAGLVHALMHGSSGNYSSDALSALIHTAFESPRGLLVFDPVTHYFLSSSVLRTFCALNKEVTDTRAEHAWALWKEYVANPPQGIVSGWTNTYLCY